MAGFSTMARAALLVSVGVPVGGSIRMMSGSVPNTRTEVTERPDVGPLPEHAATASTTVPVNPIAQRSLRVSRPPTPRRAYGRPSGPADMSARPGPASQPSDGTGEDADPARRGTLSAGS